MSKDKFSLRSLVNDKIKMKVVGMLVIALLSIVIILIAVILYANWNQLSAVHLKTALSQEVAKMDHLNGYEFEDYVALLLKKRHFKHIVQTNKNDDGGLDVLAEFNHVKYGFQCKHYKNRQVDRKVLKTTADGANYYHVQKPVIITNRYFSKHARAYQKFFRVELWDRTKLIQLIKKTL